MATLTSQEFYKALNISLSLVWVKSRECGELLCGLDYNWIEVNLAILTCQEFYHALNISLSLSLVGVAEYWDILYIHLILNNLPRRRS